MRLRARGWLRGTSHHVEIKKKWQIRLGNGEWKLLLILSAWPLLYGSERRRALFIRRLLSPTPLKYVWIAWASVARQSFDLRCLLRADSHDEFLHVHTHTRTHMQASTNTPVNADTDPILLKTNKIQMARSGRERGWFTFFCTLLFF